VSQPTPSVEQIVEARIADTIGRQVIMITSLSARVEALTAELDLLKQKPEPAKLREAK
jgi:hypothetical protein